MYNKLSASYQKKHFYNYEDEPPEKKLITEADMLIKQLEQKQRNTKTNLHEFLTQKKEFYKANEFIPLTSYTSGSSSLQEFVAVMKSSEDIEKLQSYGLEDDDIQLLFDYQKGKTFFTDKHKNMNENALKERLSRIFKQINNSINNTLEESSQPSRRETELILSEKPGSVKTKLLKFALENQQQCKEKLPHPMDNIIDIEQQLNKTTQPVDVKKIRRKARSLQKQIDVINTNEVKEPKIDNNVSSLSKNSKWDLKNSNESQNDLEIVKNKKVYTCSPQNYYTIKDNKIIRINPPGQDQKSEDCSQTRLTLEEIRKLPKFENYSPGIPSKILYIKNLAGGVTEDDLLNVFSKFGNENILSVKIMKGKMRGQAFIDMQDEKSAHNILDQCNGVVLKNKPMIIQYGKGKNG